MEEFRIKTTLTIDDLKYFYFVHQLKNSWIIVLTIIWINYLIDTAVEFFNIHYLLSHHTIYLIIKMLISGVLAIATFLYTNLKASRKLATDQYLKDYRLQYEIEYVFSEEFVRSIGLEFEACYDWTRFKRAISIRNIVILHENKSHGLIIPKNTLSTDQLNFIKSKIKKK